MNISAIEQPIEQKHTGKGDPNAVLHYDVSLNNRQKRLLDILPLPDCRAEVDKSSVNMRDLSALTAVTGDEFAMFTKGGKRMIIRGNACQVSIDAEEAKMLSAAGYKWSGHTHPGTDDNCLQASAGDMEILKHFNQDISVVYNSKGDYLTF